MPQALFAGSRIVMVSCGFTHTMVVTAVGHAWTCGENDFGVGDTANRLGFTRVDAGQLGGARIVMGACGLCHSVVVSAEVVTAKRARLDPSTVTLLVFLHEAIPGVSRERPMRSLRGRCHGERGL